MLKALVSGCYRVLNKLNFFAAFASMGRPSGYSYVRYPAPNKCSGLLSKVGPPDHPLGPGELPLKVIGKDNSKARPTRRGSLET